jgi:hypothetical protein
LCINGDRYFLISFGIKQDKDVKLYLEQNQVRKIKMKRIFRNQKRNRGLQRHNSYSETPLFERLEPRLLLNADMQGLLAQLQPMDTLDASLPADTIQANLTEQAGTLAANATTYTPQSVPYTQNFDAGLPTNTQGWEYYSDNQGRIQVVSGRLRLDDSVGDGTYSLNEAILHVNLTGQINATLSLDNYSILDETNALPPNFTSHYKGDGIAVSADGTNWITISDLAPATISVNLDLVSLFGGGADLSDVRIKFQQYDNYPAPDDGREFDNIQITAGAVAQAVPYSQNFSGSLPTGAQGWEYYSDNQGRIQIVGGRLRMDDTVGDSTYSLNEAILHVNLTGQTNVTLSLNNYSILDEVNALPPIFSSHYKGDGIAVSTDGTNWITVSDLSAANISVNLNLVSLFGAGADLSNVRIKFQQYDNYPAPDDGREFDNIQITPVASGVVAQAIPYSQNFSAGLPTGAQGWEYYSDNQGRIQVVSGQLRMDDSVGDNTYSLNEAILHLNLTGKTNVTLTLDHINPNTSADEYNPIPTSLFDGHYKGDAIALSVDGQHWVLITNLNASFYGQSFALDSFVAQAKSYAGIADVSNVRIKFQQYDNYPEPSDGREFDNILVTSTTVAPEIDVLGNSQVIIDGDTTPSTTDYTDFGNVTTGNSLIRTFTIRNTGTATLNLTGSPRVQLSGSSNFIVITQPAATVAAGGGTTVFQVQFSPTSAGLKTANIVIYNNDSNENPYNFTIQGTGLTATAPEIDVLGNSQVIVDGDTTPTVDDNTYFGAVTPGGTITRTFTIRNTGTATLNLTGSPRVQLSGDSAFTVSIQPAATVAAGGGTTTFQIMFNPTTSGIKTTTVLIYNNDSNENPYNFDIQGTGFDVPEITVLGNSQIINDGDTTPSTIDNTDFGNVTTGGSVVRTFTITNTGTDVLNLYGSPRVQVSSSSDFVVTLQPSSTVGIGGSTTFQIQFAPTGLGLKTVTVQIANTDPNEDPYDFVIQGTGVGTGIVPQAVPYSQDFSASLPTGSQGWEYYSDNQGRIQVVGGRLRLDDSVGDSTYSLNEAILHVNLTGQTNVTLSLNNYTILDEVNSLPPTFSGHYKGDGIAVSADGTNWITVSDLSAANISVNLNLVSLFGASADLSNVRIKFQQYDNYPAPDDGREFDNIQITPVASGVVAQAVPYSQNFSAGLPTGSQGWEYYSDNQGRIQVVGGRLRLDDSVGDSTYSLNEAILHVNLTGQTNVTLSLDNYSISDETNTLPPTFSGHYKGDGIAVSADGTNWIMVSDLAPANISVNLDLVSLFGGGADLSNVRIKFQQYDNYPAPDDGREFDNIQITSGVVTQAVPYLQDFSAGLPTGSQGWEYYSTNQGRIQVVGGRLRMDDSVGDSTYSLNEAILHVNLTGKTNVTLSLNNYSISDEVNALPPTFTDHYKGDGIAVSIDGTNWITVSDLSTANISVNLNLVSLFGGGANLSNVRIKFQQYDNYPAPDDGREFDNILII